MSAEIPVKLEGVRRRLSDSPGRRHWKSLEELAEAPGFLEFLHREFPEQASEWNDAAGRRDFLRLMGASLALAGLTACTKQPAETIVPYVRKPEEIVPGRPLFFATAVLDRGHAKGVLVESHEGRPTKIEGNPEHPASLGATDAAAQAAILGLYDPDRSKAVLELGEIRTWGAFVTVLAPVLDAQRALKGQGLRILTETVTSPTLAAQIEALLAELPAARWHQWDASGSDNARRGGLLAFGAPVAVQHRLEAADVILSLDADFVTSGPSNVRDVREFAARRKAHGQDARMNRLYVVESTASATGALADHRLALRPSQVEPFARAVASALGLAVAGGDAFAPDAAHGAWVSALARDLASHRGRSLVLAGEAQPPAVHALAHAMNEALGNVGTTVVYTAPVEARPIEQLASLVELADDMRAGKVDLLVVLGGNPVYTAPSDLGFGEAMQKVALRVHLGLYDDETSAYCQWHIPESHALEAWSDARAFDGTASMLQPLIAPLYDSKSSHELVAALAGRADRKGYDLVRAHWQQRSGLTGPGFEKAWRQALHDGVWAGTAFAPAAVSVRLGEWASAATPPQAGGLELAFRPDPHVGDGRFANNGWLQELPRPLTRLTWENAVLVAPATARTLGLAAAAQGADGTATDIVELSLGNQTLAAPAWILPGQPEGVLTLHLGYGRTRAGRVGNGAGFDAYRLRRSDALWSASGVEAKRTAARARLACTQDHWSMEGRGLVRSAPLGEYLANPALFHEMGHDPDPAKTNVYPGWKYEGHAWGMAIDLSACVGCNACVTACQSENNIPVVGKDQVARGREMQWIRVDRYFEGDADAPSVHHQPVLCMHCEQAPCEVVCPVAATVHSDEGLNDMVYNRCVGTRYCSNNCPYKVRRFNFLLYQDWDTPSLKLMRNPDVTVRSRGVMEKCSYCVQRINQARIDAKNEGRPIRDGEIRTACEAACPAQAIVFGDVNDPDSRVSRAKRDQRSYGLLTELQTRPRTTYLAALKNPNPEMPRG